MIQQLKLFDALTKLVPGITLIIIIIPSWIWLKGNGSFFEGYLIKYKDYSAILSIVFFIISYLVGYLLNTVASMSERVLFISWGGRPSSLIFSEKSKEKRINDKMDILNFLVSKTKDITQDKPFEKFEDDDYRRIFQTARRICYGQTSKTKILERIEDFNNQYIFSRNVFFAFLLIVFNVIILYYYDSASFSWVFMSCLALILSWHRCKSQGIYFAREIIWGAYESQVISS